MVDEVKQGLLAAFRRLLKPLIRILLRNGISFGEFSELSKEVYVDVAATDFKVPNRKMSQARVAILTGLTRKEVSRFYGDDKEPTYTKSNLNRVTRVLTGWHTDSDFTGPYGLPLELSFEDEEKKSFTDLVQRYSGDMAARAMLDELIRIEAIVETEKGWYKVLTRTYLPEVYAPDAIDLLGESVKSFVETIDNNNLASNPENRNFERQVIADDGIKAEDLPRLRAFIKDRAQILLEEIDNWIAQLDTPDPKVEKVIQTGLGIYHFVSEEEEQKKSK